ncbi:MAG: cardiolipin synthase [Gammaproteobacteria bacterium]|nr:cardiolipin synthase [Gammaproteobacteria bacterium]NNL51531.1 cardiolipin synthase [Woeseiaceae bacterium]
MDLPFTELVTNTASLSALAIAYGVLEILAIIAAVHAVFNARSSQGSTAWALALVAAPIIALPGYLVFGRNRFSGYVDARRDADLNHGWIAQKARTVCDAFRSDLPDYGGRLSFLERLAHLPFTYGNHLQLHVDGKSAFDAIFAAIKEAKSYVLIQFFIVRDDELGRRLQELLIEKSRAGVRVYFLFDQLGSRKLPGRVIREYRDAGVKIDAFRSSKFFANPMQINFRNHRKIVVLDGDLAFVGGLNVGVEYLGKSKKYGAWRDTHVSVEGPSADALQLIFAEDWHWATGETIEGLEWETRAAQEGNADVLVLPSGPADAYESCNLMFVHAIHSAQHRFWIASPYFVPNAEVVSALQVAGLRGVDVRILLPDNPDHFMVYLASFYFMKLSGDEGIRFYRYTKGFMHQKTFLIDDFGVGIGTANLDNRSFRLNFEVTLLSVNYDLAASVQRMFENDFANSRQVAHDEIRERNPLFKLGAAGARLLSPIL